LGPADAPVLHDHTVASQFASDRSRNRGFP